MLYDSIYKFQDLRLLSQSVLERNDICVYIARSFCSFAPFWIVPSGLYYQINLVKACLSMNGSHHPQVMHAPIKLTKGHPDVHCMSLSITAQRVPLYTSVKQSRQKSQTQQLLTFYYMMEFHWIPHVSLIVLTHFNWEHVMLKTCVNLFYNYICLEKSTVVDRCFKQALDNIIKFSLIVHRAQCVDRLL